MADTHNMLRGSLYSTHLRHRCLSFKQCACCKMCENYTKSCLQCVLCESRKVPPIVCECSADTKLAFIKLTELLKVPFSDPNANGSPVPESSQTNVAYNPEWENIANGLTERYGKISRQLGEELEERYSIGGS